MLESTRVLAVAESSQMGTAVATPDIEPRHAPEQASDLRGLLDAYERSLILAALGAVGGRQRSAARLLRILPTTLHEKMKRLGIRAQRAARRPLPGGDPDVAAFLRWKGSLQPGGTLEVRGLNGPVRIEAGSDEYVEIHAARRGPRAVLSAIEVQVVEHAKGVTVCAVCQLDGGLLPRTAGHVSRRVASLRVDLVVKVPPGVPVVASTVNHDIDVVGLASIVEAGTANGRVRFLPAASQSPGPSLALGSSSRANA